MDHPIDPERAVLEYYDGCRLVALKRFTCLGQNLDAGDLVPVGLEPDREKQLIRVKFAVVYKGPKEKIAEIEDDQKKATEKPKRGRGRPKGSKNRPKEVIEAEKAAKAVAKKKRVAKKG